MSFKVAASAFSVAVISSFKNSLRISEVSSVYPIQTVLLSFRIRSQFTSNFLKFFGKYEAKSLLLVPFLPNSCSPAMGSNSSNTASRGTSLNRSSSGDAGGGSAWYRSSGSSSFFLPFQRFFILYQARSSVEDPPTLPATLAVSLVVSATLNSLSSLRTW